MNAADNASSTVAVDSLLNYEVISWFYIVLVFVPPSYPLVLLLYQLLMSLPFVLHRLSNTSRTNNLKLTSMTNI
jgi:hypothetical protein